jgi:hypothetical protein
MNAMSPRVFLFAVGTMALAQQLPPISARSVPAVEADRSTLRWKRHRAVQHDLMRALSLSEADVCRDLDGEPCAKSGRISLLEWIRVVGTQTLAPPSGGPGSGGPPPANTGTPEQQCAQLQRGAECQDAPYIDVESASGLHLMALGGHDPMFSGLYKPIDEPMLTTPLAMDRYVLGACGERTALDAKSTDRVVFTKFDISLRTVSPTTSGLRAQVVDLYQRILSRDPSEAEISALLTLLEGTTAMSGEQFARLSCYVIATTREFVFQ